MILLIQKNNYKFKLSNLLIFLKKTLTLNNIIINSFIYKNKYSLVIITDLEVY